ncbi:GNAT family N-acetyltransferase [Actinoplanes sp. NPDC049802]|uniref:GNAT family N-acetyltransferase n=1 Tax=Actinoplanes sp. NPDC049802 TaxID=3154742 RepID=UPI0033EF2E09
MSDWEVRLIGSDGLTTAETAGVVALLRALVADGAALGWTGPPPPAEVEALLAALIAAVPAGDVALAVAFAGQKAAGFGYWRRHHRPTHRPHADLERLAVDPDRQGTGLGRTLLTTLIAAALRHRIEVLTLDLRADNTRAAALCKKMGFHQYGRLDRFVAVGDARYDELLYALDLRELRGPAAG